MAAANCTLSEDQFVCSICLSVFVDPVSIPCGHNFCKACISSYWDKSCPCVCPLCKENFNSTPQLKINTLLSHMASQFLKKPEKQAEICEGPEEQTPDTQVFCDVCTGTKLKAVKSCLVCLVSYCETHLEPHGAVSVLKHHQLVEPVTDLESRMCAEHHKPLELFCKTDSICICTLCSFSDHKSHNIVPMGQECEERKAEVKQMIEERKKKVETIRTSLELNQKAADKETKEGLELFTTLEQAVQKNMEQFKEETQEKRKKNANHNNDSITELEVKISELEQQSAEMEKPSYSQDQLHFLKTFPSLKSDPNTKTCSELSICQASFERTVVRSLFELEKTFSEVLNKTYQADLKAKQKYAVNITFDPNTAHSTLIPTHGNKQIHYCELRKNVPDNPERFSVNSCVFAQQSFSSGRFYFEVQVKGKTHWFLGVGRETLNRKENLTVCSPLKLWIIYVNDGKLMAGTNPFLILTLRRNPSKVGVFVDYEEGVVSFYDLDAAAPIYIFTDCSFKDALRPLFSPESMEIGINKSPMIILSVPS